ncbi:hypothetical protein FHR78_002484 [Frigoribacterium faeni]|nr:hypothetical protein [Frigoribacterium faeni]
MASMPPAPSPAAEPDQRLDPSADAASARLDARYGRSSATRRRGRWIAIAVAASFVLVFAAWVVFAAFDGDGSKVEGTDVGYTVLDDRAVDVQYTVSVAPGTAVDCAVQAQNQKFSIVGWKVVHLPASSTHSTTYTTSLATSERAVTGLIYECWLP